MDQGVGSCQISIYQIFLTLLEYFNSVERCIICGDSPPMGGYMSGWLHVWVNGWVQPKSLKIE